VRIALSGPPYRVGICHCLHCRKHHGAVFHTSAIFPVDAVTIRARPRNTGTGTSVPLPAPRCSGAPATRSSSCRLPRCADQLRPTYESWVIRREDWLPPFDVARHYQRDREGKGRSEP
jgi:hypothetical protein